MKKPRKASLQFALGLFAEGLSRAQMDQRISESGALSDPNAQAVRYCWTTGREWVEAQLKAGKDYPMIETEAQKPVEKDTISAAVRLAALNEVKAETHVTPQLSGSDFDEKPLHIPFGESLAASGIL